MTKNLKEVLEEHPALTEFGIGVFNWPYLSKEERTGKLKEGRKEIREEVVYKIVDWLVGNVAPIVTASTSSYYGKHLAEKLIGEYVTNGEFIAAAFILEYPYAHYSPLRSPNVMFAMSRKDINRISKGLHS